MQPLRAAEIDSKSIPVFSNFFTFVSRLALQPSEKCGVLNVTKITENGKKVRWERQWTKKKDDNFVLHCKPLLCVFCFSLFWHTGRTGPPPGRCCRVPPCSLPRVRGAPPAGYVSRKPLVMLLNVTATLSSESLPVVARSLAATSRNPSSPWTCAEARWSGPPRRSRARSTSSRYRRCVHTRLSTLVPQCLCNLEVPHCPTAAEDSTRDGAADPVGDRQRRQRLVPSPHRDHQHSCKKRFSCA